MVTQKISGRDTRLAWRMIAPVAAIVTSLILGVVWGVTAAAENPVSVNSTTGAGIASGGAFNVSAAARTGKWIEVVLSRQRLYAWQNGRIVMSSAISSGVSRYPTLRGTFRVYVKYWATRMRGPGYNLPGVPYTMYYYRGYAIHGAYWHNNFGHPMSHGCVNLPVWFARRLFLWAPMGIMVVVH